MKKKILWSFWDNKKSLFDKIPVLSQKTTKQWNKSFFKYVYMNRIVNPKDAEGWKLHIYAEGEGELDPP